MIKTAIRADHSNILLQIIKVWDLFIVKCTFHFIYLRAVQQHRSCFPGITPGHCLFHRSKNVHFPQWKNSNAGKDKHAANGLTQIISLYLSSALLGRASGFHIFKSPFLQLSFVTLGIFTGFLIPSVHTLNEFIPVLLPFFPFTPPQIFPFSKVVLKRHPFGGRNLCQILWGYFECIQSLQELVCPPCPILLGFWCLDMGFHISFWKPNMDSEFQAYKSYIYISLGRFHWDLK